MINLPNFWLNFSSIHHSCYRMIQLLWSAYFSLRGCVTSATWTSFTQPVIRTNMHMMWHDSTFDPVLQLKHSYFCSVNPVGPLRYPVAQVTSRSTRSLPLHHSALSSPRVVSEFCNEHFTFFFILGTAASLDFPLPQDSIFNSVQRLSSRPTQTWLYIKGKIG